MKLLYFYLIAALTVVDVILLLVSVKNWDKKAVKSLSFVVLLIIISHVFYGASLIIKQPEIKFFMHELKFLGVAFFSIGFYVMYMELFDRQEMLATKYKIIFSVVPAISVLLAVTNNYHHLFRSRLYVLENDFGSFVGVQSGPLFWVYIIYSYSVYLFVIGIAIISFFKTPKIYRMQLGIMVLAAIATLFINFISISNIFFVDFGDATLISFTIAAIIQFYGLVLYKPVGMIHIARNMAVNQIKDPLVIFDYKDQFLDANTSAGKVFNFTEVKTLEDFLSLLGLSDSFEETAEIDGKWYKVEQRKISDEDGVFSVSAILMNDITEIKTREQELQTLANRDYLTGIANRHAYMRELKKVSDSDLPVAIIRISVGGMKMINNAYGSDEGDRIIKKVADALTLTRGSGFCARIGGAEFALLLRKTTEAAAREIIETLRAQLPEIAIICGLAVKQSNLDNINIIDKIAMDNMNMNKLLTHSGRLLEGSDANCS